MAGGRRRQDAILADQELLDTVGSTNLGNQLDNLWVPIPPVAADDEESAWDDVPSAKIIRKLARQIKTTLPSAPSGIESKTLATNDSL